jgi:hypothetical protein
MIPDLDGFSTQVQARNVTPKAAGRHRISQLPRRPSITDLTGVHRERIAYRRPTTAVTGPS